MAKKKKKKKIQVNKDSISIDCVDHSLTKCSLISLDYSEVHNIDDSDDEAFEERNLENVRQIPTSHNAKTDINVPIKSYDSEHNFDEHAKFGKHSMSRDNISSNSSSIQYRNYLKRVLQKQSASKFQRYLAVKRSIKWYVCQFLVIRF